MTGTPRFPHGAGDLLVLQPTAAKTRIVHLTAGAEGTGSVGFHHQTQSLRLRRPPSGSASRYRDRK
jgi:hypothetical protein